MVWCVSFILNNFINKIVFIIKLMCHLHYFLRLSLDGTVILLIPTYGI